ncbi:MAG: threonine--tRNA ligase [Puniceicoccales bacterium]|jgi:threonyl-tRNA synthetase|nr:threonine--tRNA ligase [Puniceicoccales bacterium]
MTNSESELLAIRHSAAHVLAAAVLRLFPGAKLDIGPTTSQGFYYDIDLASPLTAEDLPRLEEEMRKIIAEDQVFECQVVSREEAAHLFREKGQPYKLERLADIPSDETITLYRNGEFIDLCRGGHVGRSSEIKAFKLLSIAGAYYRGDEKNRQLQRIYGSAFASQNELDAHLFRLEEAKKRDHRRIGKEMQLFLIDENFGQGLILWLPRGAIIRHELQKFLLEELEQQGYEQVFTPHIARLELFRTSGHFPYYRESQYPPLPDRDVLGKLTQSHLSCGEVVQGLERGDFDGFLLKPMNCPGHIQIYRSQTRSYRELPLRLAEFGTVYRWEQSGELSGLTRSRGFTQDDAHIFCTEEQLEDEINRCLQIVQKVFATLRMSDFRVRIGLRDPDSTKYVGEAENWDSAEAILQKAAEALGVPVSLEAGEAAFYGPKIDFVIRDVIGREWQLGTIQVDYNLPQRFQLSYTGNDNQPHRPIMIHRAPLGSFERFCGLLIEHFGGDFPTWLAPEQVRILSLSDSLLPEASRVLSQLKARKIRASLDGHSEPLGAKIRRAELERVPHLFILGPKEAGMSAVSIRSRIHKGLEGSHPQEEAVAKIVALVQNRTLPELQTAGH